MFAPKKILVPTDFSEFSDDALSDAIDIAAQYKAAIYLLHVLGVVQQCSVDYCLPYEAVEAVRGEAIQSAKNMMEKQIERVKKAGGIEIETDIVEGRSVSEEILHVQKTKDVDLIVIASHGRSGLLHHLLGSVADKVTRGATCPVYLVRRQR
jgi:nucleotide-binding universal stress UspA family protein